MRLLLLVLRWFTGRIGACAGVLGAAAVVYPLALRPGVPAYQHDWIWPAIRAQCIPYALSGSVAWHADGLGFPAAYPESMYYRIPAGVFCWAAGPHAGLAIYVFATLALAAIAFDALLGVLSRRWDTPISPTARALATITYVAGPITLNAVQAGHLKLLLAYALLPAACAVFCERRTLQSAALAGAIAGLCAAQPQFLGLTVLAVLALSISTGTFSLLRIAIVLAVAALVNAPSLLPAFSPGKIGTLDAFRPLLRFEIVQSASIRDALRALGYTAGYDARLIPVALQHLYWIVPALFAAGCVVLRRRSWPLVALAVVAVATCSAWKSPLAPLWTFSFTHVGLLATYRELYNVAALLWLAYAIGAALAYVAIARVRFLGVAIAVALVALALVTATRSAATIPTIALPVAERARLEAIADASPFNRYLALPGLHPAALAPDLDKGGYTPWFLSLPAHPTAFSGAPVSPLLYVSRLATEGRLDRNLLALDGIGSVTAFPNWSFDPRGSVEPSVAASLHGYLHPFTYHHTIAERIPTSMVAVMPFAHQPATIASLARDGTDIDPLENTRPVSEIGFTEPTDPTEGWAETALTSYLPSWSYAVPLDLFTLRASAPLRAPAAYVIAGDATGSVALSGCMRRMRLDAHFSLFSCGGSPMTISGVPPLVIGGTFATATPARAQPPSGAPGRAVVRRLSNGYAEVAIDAQRGSVIVFRQTFDDDWHISIPGARHVRVDGYANGWVLREPFSGVATISYAGNVPFALAQAVSLLALVSGVTLAAFERRTA